MSSSFLIAADKLTYAGVLVTLAGLTIGVAAFMYASFATQK